MSKTTNTNPLESEQSEPIKSEVKPTDSNESVNKSVETNNTAEAPSDMSRTLGFIVGFFGIYFLVIGLFSLLAILVLKNSDYGTGSMPDKDIYSLVLTITSIFISIAAIFIGFKLIKRLDSGRKLFNVLTVFSIFVSIAQYTYNQHVIGKSFANMPPELAAAARGSESASSQLVFILPAVLVVIALILNFKKIKQWFTK